jgi:hypothetical protein
VIKKFLTEESLKQFARSWISNRNKKFYNIRKQNNNEAKFIEAVLNETDGDLTLFWKITPTYGAGKDTVKGYDTEGNPIELKYYTLMVQFVNIQPELESWKDKKFNEKRADIFEWITNWDPIKLYCNDPSFFGQGAWYRLAKKDASIFPFPKGFADHGVWASRHHHGDKYLTKHFLNMLDSIKFNAGDIVKSIEKEL